MRVNEKTTPLSELPIGATGTIRQIAAARHLARRLMEMGLLPGTRVTVQGIAPMGDPVRLSLRGYALSIRKLEAASILLSDIEATS